MIQSFPNSAQPDAAAAGGAPRPEPRLDPGLYVVSTPIGNLRDITLRALDTLGGVDCVYAEDTRVARVLLDAHGLKPRLKSYHEHNAERAREEILALLAEGKAVALISDAGTPLVSDPGFKLVRAALEAGARVIPAPGASAALAALVAAGLPSDRFFFAGFLPTRSGARRRALAGLADVPGTLIFYETAPRLAASLADMAEILGARPAAVARELTKRFEEVRRGDLAGLAAAYASDGPPRGEIVVLVAPPPEEAPPEADEIDAALLDALATSSAKDAAALVSQRLGVSRREAYQRALALKGSVETEDGHQ